MKERYLKRVLKDELCHLCWGYFVSFTILLSVGVLSLYFVPLIAIFLDLDHFVASRGLSLEKSLTLPRRPALHSLTLAIAISLAISFLLNPIFGYVLFSAWLSHLLWDMGGGTVTLFWPLKRQFHLPRGTIYICLLCLFLVSLILASSGVTS